MRSAFLLSLVTLITVTPVMAYDNYGTVALTLRSTDDNSALDQNTAIGIIDYGVNGIPTTIPVQVSFSATTEGMYGPNRGVLGFYADLTGSALAVQTTTMTQNRIFGAPMGVSTTTTDSYGVTHTLWSGPRGLGFNALVDLGSLTPGTEGEGIYGFGAVQAMPPDLKDFGNLDAQYVGHPTGSHTAVAHNARTNVASPLLASNEAYVRGLTDSGPTTAGGIPAFTGTLNLLGGSNTGVINLTGGARLWWFYYGDYGSVPAEVTGSTLTILPEPSALVLLALGGWVVLRRRNL